MARTLMMMSGLVARVPMLRFPFACAALAAIAAGAYVFVPWGGVWGWMSAGPAGADGFLSGIACLVVWAWAVLSAVFAAFGFAMTFEDSSEDSSELSEYPIWWIVWTVNDNTHERQIEVWRVLAWLPFVLSEFVAFALLFAHGLVRLLWLFLRYPVRLIATVATFNLARFCGRRG